MHTTPPRILLVEDDELLASGLRLALARAPYAVEHAGDGAQALRALAQGDDYAAVVLDLGLPLLDGTEVLKALRARGGAMPVLILSARDAVADRVNGLDLGADDYLVKPFELDELLARLRVLTRRGRAAAPTHNRRQLGALTFDLAALAVTWDGREVTLQRFEFMLLRHLAESPQRLFNRTQLEEALYGHGERSESNSIDVHIHHLRRKLAPAVIKTIRGVGYRLGQAGA